MTCERFPRRRTLVLAAVALFLGAGCGGPAAGKPEPAKAKAALVATLDAWKSGASPESLKPIVVQDMDWSAGLKLESYAIDPDAQDDTLSLRCPVTLSLVDGGGKKTERRVTYAVATAPVTTVFREFSMGK